MNGGPGSDTLTGNYGNDRLTTTDAVSGNDTANGSAGTDTCTTDPGDIRISCPRPAADAAPHRPTAGWSRPP
ncbi:hypothetical protein [Streptomyces sp. KS 21]|uniref:hypothetical protein n=1 Tax=Streptomyces sp. KS 21 TaxID=2485150 RepID=UPI001FBA0532|nr:hypothetical protein [Streptomyces sp. KS 21]